MLVEDSVSFTQVDVVNYMTTHEVGVCEFGGVAFESRREGQDVVVSNRDQGMFFGEGKRERM